jgi:hypothetical protein
VITLSIFDLPFLAVTAIQPLPPDYDDVQSYSIASDLNGLNGGTGPWAPVNSYVDLTLLSLQDTYDDMESYSVASDINGLNGGTGLWGSGYVDVYSEIGLGSTDDMESYGVGANLSGLNGGTAYFQFWGGAYNDFGIMVSDDMESYTATASLNGLNGGSSEWGGAYVS